jgi:hypothetical protein
MGQQPQTPNRGKFPIAIALNGPLRDTARLRTLHGQAIVASRVTGNTDARTASTCARQSGSPMTISVPSGR